MEDKRGIQVRHETTQFAPFNVKEQLEPLIDHFWIGPKTLNLANKTLIILYISCRNVL